MFWQKQKADFWRDVTSLGSTGFYFIIILFFIANQKTILALQLLAGYVISYGIAILIRLAYFKNRPKKETYNNTIEKIDASSFPSVHTARTVFITNVLAAQFSQMTTTFFIILTALVCYSRIAIKKHDWKDILGGIALGFITFWLIKMLF